MQLYSRILCLFFLCLSFTTLQAKEKIGGGELEAMVGAVPNNYNFYIFTPQGYEEDTRNHPLIVFLHGASLCGNNLSRVRRYGVLDAIERGKIIPALVITPQNSGGAWNPEKLWKLVQWTEEHYRVDTSRIYVLGMSLGGYGTMDFVGTYPDKIAAAMALCGGTTLRDMSGLGQLPLWIMHGTADRAVSVDQSKRVVDYLQKNSLDQLLRFDWVAGGSHGILARMFYLQKTYDWLFYHSLKDNPREVDRNFEITKEDMKSSYEELKWFKEMYDTD